jgi:predicted acyltransferase
LAEAVTQPGPPGARVYALDALRGLAILGMLLSGQLPFGEYSLPPWMYHAQVPPPDHVWNGNLPGITWVDLVFPFFLFSMGAAFPLALGRRLQEKKTGRVCFEVLQRGIQLAFLALYVQAIRPYVLSEHPNWRTWLLSLLGFFLLFPVLARLPKTWPKTGVWSVRTIGWLGAICLLFFARYPDGSGFSLRRSDIIIVVLANIALFGGLLWLFTKDRFLLRLGALGILLAIRLSNMPKGIPGWVHDIWMWSPLPWIYQLYYLQYLFIAIPGMIAGELIVDWLRTTPGESDGPAQKAWANTRYVLLALLMAVITSSALIGLKVRWLPGTPLLLFGLYGIGWWLVRKPISPTELFIRKLLGWSIFWLVLGLFFEPYEGGIKKDKATLSYYFVTSGLAGCGLILFAILIDVWKQRRWASVLIDNGQNPMIAYAGINNLVIPLLGVTGAEALLSNMVTSPFLGLVKGLITTLLVVLAVSFCTRKRIFWRT